MVLGGKDSNQQMTSHIGIVGAGIGGLCTAIALRKIGLEVSVYEQSASPDEQGAGIQLSPNASRILRALGVLDALEALSFKPRLVQFRSWKNARLIAQLPLGNTSIERHGAPYLHIHRQDLHNVLREKAMRAGAKINYAHQLVEISQNEQAVQLQFASGNIVHHDLVIACDGIKSTVRKQILNASAPMFTGHVAWRGLVKTANIPKGTVAPAATVWLGPHGHFVNYYVCSGDAVNYVAILENQDWNDESWAIPAQKSELLTAFGGWHKKVHLLIENSEACYKWGLFQHQPLETWTKSRVTLLGDACHAMLPYLAQGAAMAIEDAWVLSRMLEQQEKNPVLALPAYEKYRLARTKKMQLASAEQGDMFHLSDSRDVILRNFKLGFGSRYLPELALKKLDWIHAYDAIRGFH